MVGANCVENGGAEGRSHFRGKGFNSAIPYTSATPYHS